MSTAVAPRALHEDAYLEPYLPALKARAERARTVAAQLTGPDRTLGQFACGHLYYGLHRTESGWTVREWAPNAEAIYLVGECTGWKTLREFELTRLNDHGTWTLDLEPDRLNHYDLYRLHITWPGGEGDRIPAFARRVVQDPRSEIWSAQVWVPEERYHWKRLRVNARSRPALIYEAHVGMAQEHGGVGTYVDFREHVLPRIQQAGYNTIQLMAIQEHPYYGSFGYHVSSFFAPSSRFGTPEELKALIDDAHARDIAVIIDLVHSHAVANEVEGLSRFDGTEYQYFHEGPRGHHEAWGSRCFDYSKPQVLHFLLSNCRYWLDEFNLDGFRFDGITSMLYHDHGLGRAFTAYDMYFDDGVDENAVTYLSLANTLIHDVNPDAITVAEDMSGMPGIAAPPRHLGIGFDFRLAMGIPDCLFDIVRTTRDEDWPIDRMWHELTNRRDDERTISYVECHDQAIVGDKTMIFELIDAEMYESMGTGNDSLTVDRGISLHKMLRLATVATAGDGYLNFMGNEFGHPEWIDFPREGNDWSYHYARRQWSLRDDPSLKYSQLAEFDRALLAVFGPQSRAWRNEPQQTYIHCDDKILVFCRGPLLAAFNFHPDQSVRDYAVDAPAGEYNLVLNTDDGKFGGHGRIKQDQAYLTSSEESGELSGRSVISVYLPSRTALVAERDG